MHGLFNYVETKAKYRHLKKFTCKGTYTVSHVGIFDPAFSTVSPLPFSLVQAPPPPPV
jgi:hypothetical protein